MERMRWLTVILVSLLLAAGVLPAAAGGTDDPSTAPSARPGASAREAAR
ncbi:MAG: hypothetical protein IPG68_05110 [Micrococcales bacterium]|nr:hypothetical protein [Micrococcales bacterium]